MKWSIATITLIQILTTTVKVQQVDFSGTWVRTTEKCNAGELSINSIPLEISVKQEKSKLEISRRSVGRSGDTTVYTEKLNLDSSATETTIKHGLIKKSTLMIGVVKDELEERAEYMDGSGKIFQKGIDNWSLTNDGKMLQIKVELDANGHSFKMVEVYYRK